MLEIKTRAARSSGPLLQIEKYMFVQVQLNLFCMGRTKGVLMSYHPESSLSSYFLITVDSHLIASLITILKSVRDGKELEDEDRWEALTDSWDQLWMANIGLVPDFKSLNGLRRILTEKTKGVQRTSDIDRVREFLGM